MGIRRGGERGVVWLYRVVVWYRCCTFQQYAFDGVETGSLKVSQHCFNVETPALRWGLDYPAKLSVI